MELTPHQKGDNLENAVSLIESKILRSNPKLADLPLSISTKRIFVIEGVRHEVDVYVEIDIGNGYKSIFIFECKNWKDPVNKNEIIIFEEKIKALNAQNGYFIAKSYTKDAEAQANQYKRMELFNVSEENDLLNELKDFQVTERMETSLNIQALSKGKDENSADFKEIDLNTCHITLEGKEIDFRAYITNIGDKIIDTRFSRERTEHLAPDTYDFEYKETLHYNDTLFFDEKNMEKVNLTMTIRVAIYKPIIKYSFDVQSRGKIVSLEKELSTGHKLNMVFIR